MDALLDRPSAALPSTPLAVSSEDGAPTLAIVIPVFKHPVLVSEAIACAIREARAGNGVVVIVNDGCPYEETHLVCLTFAQAEPSRIAYLRTPNGGLSAARNRGIRHALERFPSVRHVYLLDADNRVSPGAMRRVAAHLEAMGADWVYPNIDKFGMEWSGDYSAPYSVLRHLIQNVCEAGSMIHRRVFDAGVFFDEGMRQGYEDWEFWLQCVDAGFRGTPYADFGFQYRARRESMVRDSNRSDAEIMAYVHRKHKKLFSWKNIIRLEHAEAPRFCIFDCALNLCTMTSVPGEVSRQCESLTVDNTFWGNVVDPHHHHFPHFMIWTDQRIMRELARLRILDWLFWQIEDLLETNSFAFVDLQVSVGSVQVRTSPFAPLRDTADIRPFMVATTRECLLACVKDASTGWVDSLATKEPSPKVGLLSVSAPFARRAMDGFAVQESLDGLFRTFRQLRASPLRQDEKAWEWRVQDALIPSHALYAQVRTHMSAMAPLARCALNDEREIAFLLPVVSFGGVEQVAIQVARQFKRAGWKTRLIVTGSDTIAAPERLEGVFDACAFLNDMAHATWNPSGYKYFGHDLQKWASEGKHDRLIGLLAGCAAVFNFQAMHSNEVMGWLRRQGIRTLTSLHLVDRDKFGAPEGHPYWMLAYEHAYDVIAVPSEHLLGLCNGLGVPKDKLVLLRNAPSFEAASGLKQRRMAAVRRDAEPGQAPRPLRVLSLGRLDRQKGIERLAAVIRAARNKGMPIEWRLVGSKVVAGQAGPLASLDLDGIDLQPAVYDRASVIRHLSWADVSILLSHWEGSPLSILEAQSLGVIPLATNVGAVREMIKSGRDGLLIASVSTEETAASTVEALIRLQDPKLRYALVS